MAIDDFLKRFGLLMWCVALLACKQGSRSETNVIRDQPYRFTSTTESLPVGYKGTNLTELINRLESVSAKHEFETSKQFEERVTMETSKPLSNGLPILGDLPFVQDGFPDGVYPAYYELHANLSYDADKTEYRVSFWPSDRKVILTADASGIVIPDWAHTVFTIRVALDQAPALKKCAQLLVYGHVDRSTLTYEQVMRQDYRWGGPLTFVSVVPSQIWLFDECSGRVLKKVDVKGLHARH